MQKPKVGGTAEMFIGTWINWMIYIDLQGYAVDESFRVWFVAVSDG
jgi:hypothetical protein